MTRHNRLQQKHIEVFRAVIAGGSASEASRMLGLSQPAVSKIVAQTEILSGIPLFERRSGRLIPTAKALKLYQESDALFATLENINAVVDRVARGEETPLSIGAVPLFATTLLPEVLPRWLERSGRTSIVHTHDAAMLYNLVSARQIELALTIARPRMNELEGHSFARSPVFCALPPDHPLAAQEEIRAVDLDGEPYIALSRREGLQSAIDRAFAAENVAPREIMQVPLMASAVAMVQAGAGITFVDAFGMKSAKYEGAAFRPFAPALEFEYSAIWTPRTQPGFDRSALLKVLTKGAEKIVRAAHDFTHRRL